MQKIREAENNVEKAIKEYGDMVFRVCFVTLKNEADAQDAVQDTFIKYMQKAPRFENSEHEKAWLIRVATNRSRDMLKKRIRYAQVDVESVKSLAPNEEAVCVLEALVSLPEKYSVVITLHYIDGYKVNEIAEIIGKTPSAVKMRLQKGRKLLENLYKGGL